MEKGLQAEQRKSRHDYFPWVNKLVQRSPIAQIKALTKTYNLEPLTSTNRRLSLRKMEKKVGNGSCLSRSSSLNCERLQIDLEE